MSREGQPVRVSTVGSRTSFGPLMGGRGPLLCTGLSTRCRVPVGRYSRLQTDHDRRTSGTRCNGGRTRLEPSREPWPGPDPNRSRERTLRDVGVGGERRVSYGCPSTGTSSRSSQGSVWAGNTSATGRCCPTISGSDLDPLTSEPRTPPRPYPVPTFGSSSCGCQPSINGPRDPHNTSRIVPVSTLLLRPSPRKFNQSRGDKTSKNIWV